MDTKWNNMIDKVFTFFWEKINIFKEIAAGICLIGLGLFFDWQALSYFRWIMAIDKYAYWIMANVLIAAGLGLILKKYFKQKYENWIPENESFYQKWKQEISKQERKVMRVSAMLGIVALVIDYYSYGSSFVMSGTVLIQYIVYQRMLKKCTMNKIDLLMEQLENINKNNLEKALKIERESLEKVSRSDQLRMDLVTNVSHDLKTPLTSIVGYLELLKKEELSDVVRDYVDVIVDKADKLKEMIESLFSLAKASSGNIELHMEKFEVNRLLEQITADMKDKIDESGLHFVMLLTEDNTELVSDNMYFYRICQNLLENALKYSAKGTRVFIKTHTKEEKLMLEITNTAGYFMDFRKEDIVERFTRGDKSRSTEGNGLGLAIVSSYAKALGGEFDIQIDCDQFKACLVFPQ